MMRRRRDMCRLEIRNGVTSRQALVMAMGLHDRIGGESTIWKYARCSPLFTPALLPLILRYAAPSLPSPPVSSTPTSTINTSTSNNNNELLHQRVHQPQYRAASVTRYCARPGCAVVGRGNTNNSNDSNDSTIPILRQCGRCRTVWYCSRDCQSRHWSLGHRQSCRPLEIPKLPPTVSSIEAKKHEAHLVAGKPIDHDENLVTNTIDIQRNDNTNDNANKSNSNMIDNHEDDLKYEVKDTWQTPLAENTNN
jgi:hypothetical protein